MLDDQLSPRTASLVSDSKPVILMVESRWGARRLIFHKHSLVLCYAAMRHRASSLEQSGCQVDYYSLQSKAKNYQEALVSHAKKFRVKTLRVMESSDWSMQQKIPLLAERAGMRLEWVKSNQFLCHREDFKKWAGGKNKLLMETHYRRMRRSLGILVDENGEPEGGQWNYDHDNRSGIRDFVKAGGPRTLSKLRPPRCEPDDITRQVMREVDALFPDHPGDTGDFWLPTSREQALAWFELFLKERFEQFGSYEDLMVEGEPVLFHSVLSPLLNIGLLDPLEVVERVVREYRARKLPLNSVEGFIRQIIGWREFIHGVYWTRMPEYREVNGLRATRKLPGFFYTGDTEMNCLAQVIGQVKQFAYAHHIQRLMVLGNFFLLAQIAPKEVNRWFIEMFVDAYEWVMLANVFGMILHADGGYMATKPYAASGAYIKKMSNYCANCSFDPDKKTGPGACPFNYLYWNFFATHATQFAGNPRVSMMVKMWEKKPEPEKRAILAEARAFLEGLK
nr:cryptochrome/photolyase family protein [Oscillatoria laete-virens]